MTKQELEQISRVADLTPDKVCITLQNLQKYKTKSDEKLDSKLKTTQFQASQIVEENDKKFVSQTEKDKIANTYTKNETYTKSEVYNKGEIDNKFTDLETKIGTDIAASEKKITALINKLTQLLNVNNSSI